MKYFSQRNQKGFGLTEALIAAGLLAIIAVSVTYYVVSNSRANKTVENSSQCQNMAEGILTDFKNSDTAISFQNYSPEAPPPSSGDAAPIAYEGGPNPTDEFGNFQNILNAATRLLQIYNAKIGTLPAICTTPLGIPLAADMLVNQGLLPANPTFIRIEPIDMNTNASLCNNPSALQMRPISLVNKTINIGLKTTITVQYTVQPTTIQNQCSQTSIFTYAADLVPPTLTIGGGGGPPPSGPAPGPAAPPAAPPAGPAPAAPPAAPPPAPAAPPAAPPPAPAAPPAAPAPAAPAAPAPAAPPAG